MQTTSPSAGIVGGLGPESTIDYYRRIIELWRESSPDSLPSILIDSLDMNRGIHLVTHDHEELTNYLLASVERLGRAGATFAVLAANTPHIVFNPLAARSPLPLISIVDACADEALRCGYRSVGLLGTGFTMAAAFFPEVFSERGISVMVPDEADREWLHDRYLGQLLVGDFRQETREGVEQIVHKLRARHAIDAVVLAGTELPLLLQSNIVAGLPTLDTTELHVRAIVQRLKSPKSPYELSR